jgi:hypothetical protein
MKGTVECIRCHAHMESGWVADNTHRGVERQNWSPGNLSRVSGHVSSWKKIKSFQSKRSGARTAGTWNRMHSRKPFPTDRCRNVATLGVTSPLNSRQSWRAQERLANAEGVFV